MGNSKISLLLSLLLLIVGCEKEDIKIQDSQEYYCLIVNQGNFSEANGELSLLSSNGEIKNRAYQTANQWELASIIESAIPYNNHWILFCSNEDKIEIISQIDLKQKTSIKGIPIPRYGITIDNYLYVTSVEDWDDNSSGKLFKIDLDKELIVKEFSLGNLPEGILHTNGQIWVATQDTIYVFNDESDQIISRIPTEMKQLSAKHIIEGENGEIWCSLTSHKESGELVLIDGKSMTIKNRYKIPHLTYEGYIVASPDKKYIYYLISQSIVGGQSADCETDIYKWDVATQKAQIIIKGNGFYGFNVHPKTGDIYTANVNGFITNSLFYRFDKNGEKIYDGKLVGVGACRFLFKD